MELRRYASILRRWLWLILLGTALAAASSYIASSYMPKIYEASTTLLVNQAQTPGTVAYNDILTSERLTKTYGELIRKRPILERVISELQLPHTPVDLEKMLSVRVVRDTMLLELTVESTDPQQAANIANAVAGAFIQESRRMQSGQASLSRDALREQLSGLERDIRATTDQIDRLRAGQGGRGSESQAAEIGRLQNTLSQYQVTYSQLLKSEQDMRLAESKAFGSVAVAEPAVAPTTPVRPRLLQNVLLAALVGLMLAMGVALLIEYLDDTVKSSEDVSRLLGVPTLGYVVRLKGKDVEQLPSLIRENAQSPLVESYRVLRTNLQFSLLDRTGRLILVTSTEAGEGKSTTAASLAQVMAQAGMRVILVDADLRRPSIHRHFGLKNDSGLTTALMSPAGFDPAALQTVGVENLRVLPSGPLPPNPSELLGSNRMRALAETLQLHADVVLFDAPPLVVTDPSVLARLADGVLLVVDSSGTRAEALSRARDALERVGAADKLLGVVLNKLTAKSSGYHYYYYHHYYGSGTNGNNGHDTAGARPVDASGVGGLQG